MIAGAIFDVDGVLVDSPHERAWREALDRLMTSAWSPFAARTRWSPGILTSKAYQERVAGKPRDDGARAVLDLIGFADADGSRARAYSEAKQQLLRQLIERGEFRPFDDALRLLVALKARGLRLAAASSSRNAPALLRAIALGPFAQQAGLDDLADASTTVADAFDADLSGQRVAHGKPDPAIFLRACEALQLQPASCLVIEDAPAGVQAARTGGMLAIGVARHNDEQLLRHAGADRVVRSLDEIDPDDLTAFTARR